MLQDTADRHRAYAFGPRDQGYRPSRAASAGAGGLVGSTAIEELQPKRIACGCS